MGARVMEAVAMGMSSLLAVIGSVVLFYLCLFRKERQPGLMSSSLSCRYRWCILVEAMKEMVIWSLGFLVRKVRAVRSSMDCGSRGMSSDCIGWGSFRDVSTWTFGV